MEELRENIRKITVDLYQGMRYVYRHIPIESKNFIR